MDYPPGDWDYIIVGQGLCGTLLGQALTQAGKSLLYIDRGLDQGSSLGAAGMIHPLSGKRWAQWPNYSLYLDQAAATYIGMEKELNASFWQSMDIGVFTSATEDQAYARSHHRFPEFYRPMEAGWSPAISDLFSESLDSVCISPAWKLDAGSLLTAFRRRLEQQGRIWTQPFDYAALEFEGTWVRYKHQKARAVLFAEGAAAMHNPWFSDQPFAPHRGQALILSAPALPRTHAYRHGSFMIIPWKENLWWVGASHERDWDQGDRNRDYPLQVVQSLRTLFRFPFEHLDTWAGIRPSTRDRKPIWGFHPRYPGLGILNGMGSRAMLLAPYHARQFARHILEREATSPPDSLK